MKKLDPKSVQAKKKLSELILKSNHPHSDKDILKLIHELEVHQIELEIQNEELILAKEKAEITAEKYSDLYDFAPSGYLSLTKDGNIIELNLRAADMLGKERANLIGKSFAIFMSDGSNVLFHEFLNKIFEKKSKEKCELSYIGSNNIEKNIILKGLYSENGNKCMLTIFDVTEIRQAENILVIEKAFREAIELSLLSGIAVVDQSGNQIYVNESFCKLFGFSEKELLGKMPPHAYWPPEQLSAINDAFEKTIRGQAPVEGFELVFMNKEGHRIPVQMIISAFTDGKQQLGWLANVIDISERKKTNEALHELFIQNPISIQIVDLKGHTLYTNPAFLSLFGSIPPAHFSIFEDLLKRYPEAKSDLILLKQGKVIHLPDLNYDVSQAVPELPSNPLWIKAVVFPLMNANREAERFVFLHENITERTLLSLQLKETFENLRTVYNATYDTILFLTTDYTLVMGNEAAAHRLGLTESELPGKNIKELFPKNVYEHRKQFVDKAISSGEAVIFEDQRNDRWLLNQIIPIKDKEGKCIRIVVQAKDVTQERNEKILNFAKLRLIQFSENATLEELLEETLNEAEALTGSKIGFFHFVEEDEQTLVLKNWSTQTKSTYCDAENTLKHYHIDEAGIWADALREKKPIIHNDYASHLGKKGIPQGHAVVIRELVVPVVRKGKVKCLIGVGNRTTVYSEIHISLVSNLANQIWELAEKKIAEDHIRASEEKYRLLVQNCGVGIGIFDMSGKIEFFNDKALQSLNGKLSDFEGKTLHEKFGVEAAEKYLKRFREAAGIETHIEYEDEIVWADKTFWFVSN